MNELKFKEHITYLMFVVFSLGISIGDCTSPVLVYKRHLTASVSLKVKKITRLYLVSKFFIIIDSNLKGTVHEFFTKSW